MSGVEGSVYQVLISNCSGIDIKSLYSKPENVEKKPIITIRNRIETRVLSNSLRSSSVFHAHHISPTIKKKLPWPTSPNMTPNKNGNVMMLK